MANDRINAEIQRLLAAERDPVQAEISRLMGEQGMATPDPGRGFVTRALDALTPGSMAELGAIGAGIAAPTIEAGQALFQLPGLVTTKDLPTDRVADFLGRFSEGLTTRAETAALEAGATPELIADSHLLGEIVGFTAPVLASLKAARLILRTGGSTLSLGRNFQLDTTAGLIFGSALVPEEELRERLINTSREAALFGIGGLMLNGLTFSVLGMRFARSRAIAGRAELDDKLRLMANGENPTFGGDDALDVAQLLSEEGYLATSPEAYQLLNRLEIENALIQSIRGLPDSGLSRGSAKSVGNNFTEVNNVIASARQQFPGLKFDAIRRGDSFDVHFGTTGLNNQQKAQIKREGRYAGQMIQKNGTAYLYVRKANKEGFIVARNIDGKTTTLRDRGITDLPNGVEDIPVSTTGAALYEDFRQFGFDKVRQAAAAAGGLTETDIIRFIRQGQLGITDDLVRQFESPGAITHADELGLVPGQGIATTEDFVRQYVNIGAEGAGLLEPPPIRRFDDLFEAWRRDRDLPALADDIDAVRMHFAKRFREDIWDSVPADDRATFNRIRDELTAALESMDVPFEARAGEKGFHVNRLDDGRIELRDINTGARLTFGNEAIADNALTQIVRSERDPLFEFTTPGFHGMPGLTNGFDPSDGVFGFDVNINHQDFLMRLPSELVTNRSDYLQQIESIANVPVWTEGFQRIDSGLIKMRQRLEPFAERISTIWKGINRDRRKAVAEFWTSVEGSDLTGTALVRAAREFGLSAREITAFNQARAMFDLGAKEIGLDKSRYIPLYYSRIRPEVERIGRALDEKEVLRLISDVPDATREFQFWAEMSRTGDLAQIELDPEVVMHKYFRSLVYKQEVAPFEEQVRTMLNLRIANLAPDQKRSVLQRALPGTSENSFVFPQEVQSFLQEYLNNLRGDVNPGFQSARRWTARLFKSLGIDVDPKVFDELHSTLLSTQYGAAIGLRLALMNRNATQNVWTMYTRVGSKHGGEALRRAMRIDGYNQAHAAGAIRSVEVTQPQGDAIFNAWFNDDVARGTGPLSNAAAAAIRLGIRTGRVTRQVAQKFLVPYGSGDQVNRAWAFHWQRLHTQDHLARFKSGKLDWDGFLEEGLPFYSDSVKRAFRQRLDQQGENAALDFIGKQAADEAHFIYGTASTPTWMQTPFGRLFGVFGQWPLWAKQLYFNRMAHATPRQMGMFWARSAAAVGAFTNMGVQTGVNMWNWMAPLSLGFGGGPTVDQALTAREIWTGPLDQKANNMKRLAQQVGSLSLPGQLFYTEISQALDQNDPRQAALLLTMGRQADAFNYSFDVVNNPAVQIELGPAPLSIEGLKSIGLTTGQQRRQSFSLELRQR